jgi:hypothetical protein
VDFGLNLRDFAFVNILAFADIISLPSDCMTSILAGVMADTSIVNNADEFEARYWSVTHHGAHLTIHHNVHNHFG